MVKYSLLIPQRNRGEVLHRQFPAIRGVMEQLDRTYEIICIDDASRDESVSILERLLAVYPALRLLKLDEPRGVSVALSAGIAAARGDIVIAMAPGAYRPEQIPSLVNRLSRGDLVFGRRPRSPLSKIGHRFGRIPRWLLLGLEVRDPDCLFWAARREAVERIDLPRGMFRYLPSLVAAQGYRVHECPVEYVPGSTNLSDAPPNPVDLFAAWWLCRRWRPYVVEEVTAGGEERPALNICTLSSARDSQASNSGRRDSA